MLNRLLARVGLEKIRVETKLQNPIVQSGHVLNGTVTLKGVDADKKINHLGIQLQTLVEVEGKDHEFRQHLTLAAWTLERNFILPENKLIKMPFSVNLPYELPITDLHCQHNQSRVWIQTDLDVEWGLDRHDRDFLKVQPTRAMNAFLTAMQQCGFALFSTDVEKGYLNGGYFRSSIGCYQELEFKPTQFFSHINEVEVSFVATEKQTHILLEIDRRHFQRSDEYQVLSIDNLHFDIPHIVQQIKAILRI